MKSIAVICLMFLGSIHLPAQQTVDTLLLRFRETREPSARESGYLLLRTHQNETAESLSGKGLQVLRQLSSQYFIVSKNQVTTQSFPGAVAANANWKLSPALLNLVTTDEKMMVVRKKFHLHTNAADQLKSELLALNDRSIKIEYSSSRFLVISTSLQKLVSEVLYLPAVQFAESGDRNAKEEMAIDGFDLTANRVNLVHAAFPAVNGAGMMVSIKEQKPDSTDLDLRGKYVAGLVAAPTVSAHATIMATMIAGAGNSFITGKGVAWKSAFTSSSFANLFPDPFEEYRKLKIAVQNHSYGVAIENYYGADAAGYDSTTMAIPSLLHVFSSGNLGSDTSKTGKYAGIAAFANLTGSFKMSKNSISVGAMDANGNVSSLSSRGPAYEGRLKPELVAFGVDGSSGAAAIVSGIALLCQQLYASKHNGTLPDAALVRAILANSADDVGAKGIDFISGFGNANAYRALQTIDDGRYLTGTIGRNESASFHLDVPANAVNLKIMLAWSDPPALPNAFASLVNDIDLEVYRMAGIESWKPWVLNSHPHPDSLNQLPLRGRDSLNNLEQITIQQPLAGKYEVRVKASRITNRQTFYLAYQYDTVNHFNWSYPAGEANLLPGAVAKLRWSSTIAANGTLEYSSDAGRSWTTVDANVNIGNQAYALLIPDSFHVGLLRMTVNGKTYHTDTFTISRPLQPLVGFNCPDSLLIYWNKVPAEAYILYQLINNLMQPTGVYRDSFAILPASQQSSRHYAVAPLLRFNQHGLRSYAFDYETQGVGCYFQQFLADLVNETTILNFRIGSTYGIQSISLEKYKGGSFQVLRSFSPVGTQFTTYDSILTRGINSYRVKLTFTDGRNIYSHVETVHLFTVHPFVIFPNPLPSHQPLRILSKDPEAVVARCWGLDGRKLAEKKITNTSEAFPLQLSKGIYLVEIISGGKRVLVDKLVVQ